MNPGVVLGLSGFVALNVFYIKTTEFEKPIKIKNKYVYTKFSSSKETSKTYYMVTDTDNNIYRCGKSLWFLHFANAELWESFEEKKEYNVKGYGIRFPFLSIYPNIISSDKFLSYPFFPSMVSPVLQ